MLGRKESLGSIHTCDLLGVNSCVNYSLNNGIYCTKQVYSHLQFGKLFHGLESSIMGCVPIAWTEKFTPNICQGWMDPYAHTFGSRNWPLSVVSNVIQVGECNQLKIMNCAINKQEKSTYWFRISWSFLSHIISQPHLTYLSVTSVTSETRWP